MPTTKIIRGIPASAGVAVGPAFVIPPRGPLETAYASTGADQGTTGADQGTSVEPGETGSAAERLRAAVGWAIAETEALASGAGSADGAAILEAQVMILDDPGLFAAALDIVGRDGATLDEAVRQVVDGYARRIELVSDARIRARGADVRDAGRRLLSGLTGQPRLTPRPSQPSIIVTEHLSPSEIAGFPAGMVLGLAMEKGSATCHTAILARAKGLPAVVGAAGVARAVRSGQTVVLDGSEGTVRVNPGPAVAERYSRATGRAGRRVARPGETAAMPAVTRDGTAVEVAANIASPSEVGLALDNGADGVGLFRTEFLFMDTGQVPAEERQLAIYAEVLKAARGRPVVIRVLDVGQDKDIPHLGLEGKSGRLSGRRGLRFLLDRPDLLRTQLRAIYRAGPLGRVKVMFPMVSTVEEVREVKALLAEVRAELDGEGRAYAPDIEVGLMVETPAAALAARDLAREVDFLSLGTNDLAQYTLAADRTESAGRTRTAGRIKPHIRPPDDALHPAVLRLVAATVSGAAEVGVGVGLCGELAGDPLATGLLLGLGVRALSVSPAGVPEVKERVRRTELAEAGRIARAALGLATAQEVRARLRRLRP